MNIKGVCLSLLLTTIVSTVVVSPSSASDDIEKIPPGPGSEEAFYTCSACHSFLLVAQQGLNKTGWNDVLTWMVEEQEMEPLEPADQKLILDYLTKYYGPDRLAKQLAAKKK